MKDKNLLLSFFDSFEEKTFIKKQKTIHRKASEYISHPLDNFIEKKSEENEKKIVNEKYIKNLFDMIMCERETFQKKVIICGSSLSGKSYLLDFVKQAYTFEKQIEEPEIVRIYHSAYKKEDIFKILTKKLS